MSVKRALRVLRKRMACPACGVDMNHHGDKVDYLAALTDPASVDPDLGGVLREFHSCGRCGATASRKAISRIRGR